MLDIAVPDDSEYESQQEGNQEVTEEEYRAMLKEHKQLLKKKLQVLL
jgi:hypothetical protein